MRFFCRTAAYLILAGAALGALGHLSHDLDRAISLLGLGLFLSTFAAAPAGRLHVRRSSWIAACILAVAAVAAARTAPLGLPYFHLLALAAALQVAAGARHETRLELRAAVLAMAFLVVAAELHRLVPFVWHLEQAAAGLLSRGAARLAHEPRNLGPTAMGLPLLVAMLALSAARTAAGASRGLHFGLAALVLCLGHAAYLVLLTPYASWIANHRPQLEGLILNSQWLFLLIGAALYTAMQGMASTWARWRNDARAGAAPVQPAPRADATVDAVPPARFASLRGLVRPRLAAGFLLGLLLVLVLGRTTTPPDGPVRILLYDAGYTNWKIPVHGNYGEKSGGMFGLLPGLLQAAGHQVETTADLKRLEAADAPDCLVLINIQEYLETADKERILRFVRGGGGLLCLGDHTGVAGIRGPFNDLLDPLGIRFRFDSASFFAGGWSNSLEMRHHALNRGVHNEEEYQIWVGASLELDPGASPVVVAKYGYSDLGDMANLSRSYLGDRRYNPSELLGDVVLVGEARLGRGKVLVFGDTSSYQNLALSRSYAVVLRSFRHLGHPGGATPGLVLQVVAASLFVLGLGMASRAGADPWPVAAACAGLLVTSAVLAAIGGSPRPPQLDWRRAAPASLAGIASPQTPSRTAILDRSHGGRFDMRAWYDTSVGGLTLNLIRDGFFPLVTERFPHRELETADLLVLIAPARSYSARERAALRRFMDRGGRVLVCVGYEELDGARGFLGDFGLGVRDVPLAHFRTGAREEDLVFLEAWALDSPAEAEVLVRQWGHPVVARLSVGRGELLLVGDTYYLMNRNLESRETYYLGNIRFLTALGSGQRIQTIEGEDIPVTEPEAIMDVRPPNPATPAPHRHPAPPPAAVTPAEDHAPHGGAP